MLDVSKGGRHVATLRPSEGFYASGEPAQGSVGHLIGGQAVSHVSMSAGVTRDVWTAIAPDIRRPRCAHRHDRQPHAVGRRGARSRSPCSPANTCKHPPPAQFHFIVSPLVMWIWIGGLIVFGGGLIAIWPAPSAVRRRVACAPARAPRTASRAPDARMSRISVDRRPARR